MPKIKAEDKPTKIPEGKEPCSFCGILIVADTDSHKCDRCWELYHRIEHDPLVALKMLYDILYKSWVKA